MGFQRVSVSLEHALSLMAVESVTPATGKVFDVLEEMLAPLGFEVHRFKRGEGPIGSSEATVENLFAIRNGPEGSRHFSFAGHLDVVPAGEGWSSGPFEPEVRGDMLYGRGAVDMKGAIAAMVAAVADLSKADGTISFLITGDEEGPAVHGTRALIEFMESKSVFPDLCLVGEPTSVNQLGDMIKIGRRGSINILLEVEGVQGHVAYPHLADNPISRMVKILSELSSLQLDDGTKWFQPSNLEITQLEAPNPAHNVIPSRAEARVSIRFNDQHSGESLSQLVGDIAEKFGGTTKAIISGEPFLTPPGEFSNIVSEVVQEVTGINPEISTTGGTSDARFLRKVCQVIEFGLCNATMHKKDEAVLISDLDALSRIYAGIAKTALRRSN